VPSPTGAPSALAGEAAPTKPATSRPSDATPNAAAVRLRVKVELEEVGDFWGDMVFSGPLVGPLYCGSSDQRLQHEAW
jgi:hypothetical protein